LIDLLSGTIFEVKDKENKKHLKNVGPTRHCELPHAHSPDVATDAACASMSTTTPTTPTTTTTTRDRGDRYGPMEWAQKYKQENKEASDKGNQHINNLYSAKIHNVSRVL